MESPPGDESKDSRGMKEMMKKYAALVFDWAKQNHGTRGKDKVLLVSKNGAGKWINADGKYGDTKSKKVITRARFEKWSNYLLDNLYVQVGDQQLRQVIGIPMGVSCAPYLANLMLFMYELEFFDAFISKHDPIRNKPARQLLWKLSCCTRYIDDLWNPLVPKTKFQSITRQMYPTWLQLGDPESEGTMVDYLDMTIWQQDGTWQSKLYDKRVELQAKGLKLNKFPYPETKITTRCKYGVISSQLHRFKTVCTQTSQFLDAATTLYTEYIDKGYDQRLVDKRVYKFLRRERDTLTIKPTAIKYRYQKQQLQASKQPKQVDPKH
jgi:hypothetical protein